LEDRTALNALIGTSALVTGVFGDSALRGEIAAAPLGDTIVIAAGLEAQTFGGTAPEADPAPSKDGMPPPLPLTVRLTDMQLGNQLSQALARQSAMADPGRSVAMLDMFGTAADGFSLSADAETLLTQELRLAYDLSLFVNMPQYFNAEGMFTDFLATDIVQTSRDIAANPLASTSAG
jgi:hypothetical protein